MPTLFKSLKQRVARFLFNLAWDIDFMEVSNILPDCGYGYCEDCDHCMSDEPMWCR